jgi:pantothenate kinase-related protein Tda10
MYSRYEVIRLLSSPKKLFAATVHKKATAYTWRKQQENKLPNAIYTPFHCHLRQKIVFVSLFRSSFGRAF